MQHTKTTDEIIPIFFACDDNFVKHTIVSLTSIIENADPSRKYRVHVLHTNISEKMMTETLRLKNESFDISFNDVTPYLESISDKLPLRHYYTKTTYYRLFIADMFPEYDKAIYIDSDTVVLGDISELYDTELGDCYVGACVEQVMAQMDVYGTYAERVVGVERHRFFNAGLLLINSAEWRRVKLFEEFLSQLAIYNFIVTQDEDYLNVICKGHVKLLDPKWNTELNTAIVYPYDISEAKMLHYIMVNKPWRYLDCLGADIYWSYAKKTSSYVELKAELAAYTDEQRERDRRSAENLRQMAIDETNREDNYISVINKRNPERVAILKRIDEYERNKKFDIDVEDDPETYPLMPDKVDYLNEKLLSKIKNKIANKAGAKFFDRMIDCGQLVIKEIKGIENFDAVGGGAIVTCNHFSVCDNYAVWVALREHMNGKLLYKVIREGNYTNPPKPFGLIMRHCNTLPLSSQTATMKKFLQAVKTLLERKETILIYPEQSMWWNYRKPKPLQDGAFMLAVKNNAPIVPIFITMEDSNALDGDGFFVQEYTINVLPAIYPDTSLSHAEAREKMKRENYEAWVRVYEDFYKIPLVYGEE